MYVQICEPISDIRKCYFLQYEYDILNILYDVRMYSIIKIGQEIAFELAFVVCTGTMNLTPRK